MFDSPFFAPGSQGARAVAYALTLPEAWSDVPWDHTPVIKVRKKVFVFLGDPEHFAMSVKLPQSMLDVLKLPHAKPSGYGLGRHGWCHITVGPGVHETDERLREWIRESYLAVAPKTLGRAMLQAELG